MIGARGIITAAVLAAIAGAALFLAPSSPENETTEGQAMSKTHEIGIVTSGGFVPLGRLSFDAANVGTLVLAAPHPRTPDLVRAWKDLAKAEMVSVKTSVRLDEGTGDEARGLVAEDFARSDPGYPEAVLRILARNHGFDSRP